MHTGLLKTARRLCGFAALWTALVTLPCALAVQPAQAQDISIGGFVKAEYIYDSRQVAQVREGQFLLFPSAESIVDGEDANETDNLGFFAFQSRLQFAASGAQVLGGEASGVIEADFFGATNDNISTFRLRNAFARLEWEDREVLFGQYWSPLFTVAVFPQTVSFNTGAPFQPFARYPQARLTLKPGNLRLIGALSTQRDAFAEIGGPKLQQQSGLPSAHLHVQYNLGPSVFGGGAYIKSVRPALTSDRFTAGAFQAYAKLAGENIEVRLKGTYGNDLADHLMTGGFVTGDDGEFYPTQTAAGWVDIQSTGPVSVGLFGGYLTQLGVGTDVDGAFTNARTPNLEYQWRLSPRLVVNLTPVRFAFELEATSALYADGFDSELAPDDSGDTDAVTNVRGLFAVFYFF